MRRLERRAIMCLMLAAVLFLGIVVFSWRFVTRGGKWASFYGNTQVYTDGVISRGSVCDRNGILLASCTEDGIVYVDDTTLRKATAHAVGDPGGNIPYGAVNYFKDELIGYDLLNGTYDASRDGKSIQLTIDAEANRTAYNYLSYYDAGLIGVFNYKTGEIVCMVSTPAVDPAYYDDVDPDSAVYYNNFIQATLTPGSTFKLVTAAAAIETLDMEDYSFDCDGYNEYGGDAFRCVAYHGEEDFYDALANSCNGAFGEITRTVGAGTMKKYVNQFGLTSPVDIDGIQTAKGSFSFPGDDDVALSWAGIGQGEDLVNPCAMMVYVGAIANDGEAVAPRLLKRTGIFRRRSGKSLGHYLDAGTAAELRKMMKNNVESSYGAGNFPELDIYAKSGTAEVGYGETSWFVGFIDDEAHPYAFVCWVDGGYGGAATCGPIVRATLYTLIENN